MESQSKEVKPDHEKVKTMAHKIAHHATDFLGEEFSMKELAEVITAMEVARRSLIGYLSYKKDIFEKSKLT